MIIKLYKQIDLKGQNNLYRFTLYVADPATCLASDSVLGPYFPLRTASFMEQCLYYYL